MLFQIYWIHGCVWSVCPSADIAEQFCPFIWFFAREPQIWGMFWCFDGSARHGSAQTAVAARLHDCKQEPLTNIGPRSTKSPRRRKLYFSPPERRLCVPGRRFGIYRFRIFIFPAVFSHPFIEEQLASFCPISPNALRSPLQCTIHCNVMNCPVWKRHL